MLVLEIITLIVGIITIIIGMVNAITQIKKYKLKKNKLKMVEEIK